ncbi:FliM/FliN family flagellar motor switch protein [Beijerinckia sp. L45]|uniref:FliM/FliN family flagellar motor switch protein n=1 Tax=Beijerinckia sp. L45 TaxID=1641855 RepID=UPI00131D4003|nr:FliM/FliN family flagellar motor switch protein [Beijerinckia sp. L45]
MSMASLGSNDTTAGHANQASLLGGGSATMDAPPLLEDALDRIAEVCGARFETLAGENMTVTCMLVSLTTETAADVMAAHDPAAMSALFEIPIIGSRLLVNLEDSLLQLVIELMCGGTCSEPVADAPRAGTSIDRQFARVIFNLLTSVIEKQCISFGLGGITLGQVQGKIDVAALGKRNTKVSIATLSVECLGRRANLRLAFPQAITDRFRQDMLPKTKDVPKTDPAWTERFQSEIGRAVVRVDAFLAADTLTLGQIATLKIGQILTLPKSAPSTCELRCDEKPLFRCELGQAEGRYSLRIEENLPRAPADDAVAQPRLSPLFDFS